MIHVSQSVTKNLTRQDIALRLTALSRAGNYGDALMRRSRNGHAPITGPDVLDMLAKNYTVRIGELWRLYQAADFRANSDQDGATHSRGHAREALRQLMDEDSGLVRALQAFGVIVPKTLQLHGSAKDTIEQLRQIRREVNESINPNSPAIKALAGARIVRRNALDPATGKPRRGRPLGVKVVDGKAILADGTRSNQTLAEATGGELG